MMFSLFSLRVAASVSLVCGALSASAQVEEVRAARANLTLSLTITETVGGYKVTDTKMDTDFNKGLTYDVILNPHDFDAEVAGFNYYAELTTLKQAKLADGFFYPTETIVRLSRRATPRRYLTADFIKDLIARGGVLAESAADANAWRGYLLVAVTFKDFDEGRRFFFAEKAGKAPVFVGWESQEGDAEGAIAGHYLNILAQGGAEGGTRTAGQKIKYITERIDGMVSITEDIFDPPAPTLVETASGKTEVRVRVFPGDTLPLRDMRFGGRATYSERYDARQGVYLNGAVAASGLAGNKYSTGTPDAMVEGTVSIGAEVMVKATAAITSDDYWAAVPESLRPAIE